MRGLWELLVEPPSYASCVAPSHWYHRSERYLTEFRADHLHCSGVEATDTVLGLLEPCTETTFGLFAFVKFT